MNDQCTNNVLLLYKNTYVYAAGQKMIKHVSLLVSPHHCGPIEKATQPTSREKEKLVTWLATLPCD
jgi:hypothetical protein